MMFRSTDMPRVTSEYESLRTWEGVSHTELPHFASTDKTEGDLRAILPLLSREEDILDLGCGWGRMAIELTRRGYKVRGIDLSPNLIAFARQRAEEDRVCVRFDVGNRLDLPYDDRSFDKIVCLWGVFSHLLRVEEQVAAVDQMFRVMRPGGSGFVEVSNGELKRYRAIRREEGLGPDKRIIVYKYEDFRNTLYVHERSTLERVARRSRFRTYRVKFQNINRRRRLVLLLHRHNT